LQPGSISNTASTTITPLSGNAETSTQVRTCRPRSPKMSTNKSEQPSIAAGWSVQSGVEFT
jgi:hypothetical protein